MEALLRHLRKGQNVRAQFVESHLAKSLAYQTRTLRNREGWTQRQFAEKIGAKHPNNVSARLENPNYGSQSLTSLKKIAAACDVALVVWFIPFSRMLHWVTGTPFVDNGLSEEFYNIPTFADEFEGRSRTEENPGLDLGRIEDRSPRKDVRRAEEDDDETGELGNERHWDAHESAAEQSGNEKGLAAQARD